MNLNVIVKAKVFEFLESKSASARQVAGGTEEQELELAYLDTGLIDSFGLIEMITVLEEEFAIRFDAADLHSKEFRTIGGLISIITRMVSEKHDPPASA